MLSSADPESVLPQLVKRAVPILGEWCAVDLIDSSGALRRAAEAAAPEQLDVFRAIDRSYAALPSPEWGYRHVAQTQNWEVVAPEPDRMALLAQAEPALGDSRRLSGVCVPFQAHAGGGSLGVFTALRVREQSGVDDLESAQKIARRIGLAVGNFRLLRRAQDASRLKDEFLAVVSHELRTPLAGVLIWSQLLRAGDLDEAGTTRALDMIERGAKSLEQIIEDLIDVSRVMTGKLKLDLAPVDLLAVIEQAVDAARPRAEAEGIRLESTLQRELGSVNGDFVRLQQVMNNLLANAIKFTTTGGQIQVRLDRQASQARIRVVDTGGGIDPALLPHVFERFWQAEGGTTRRQGGLGLGLAIVRHIVELHRGRVRAESAGEGRGTTLEVLLPLSGGVAAARPVVERQDPRDQKPPRIDGLRILMVEDDTDTRDALKLVLEKSGAEVVAVGSGREALAVIENAHPDVMLCDIAMPEEDGYAVINKVRQLGRERSGDVPAVAVTAYASQEDRARALSSGFQAHVAKPVEPAQLLTIINSLAHTTHSA